MWSLFKFDLVVSCGGGHAAARPDLPGMPPHYRWELPEVALDAPEPEVLGSLRLARDHLERKIDTIFAADLVHGLSVARMNLELVLDNLAHAVMAHTMNRRVFYFNQAAERITGYAREEVIGKDCHEVFKPLRFCGGDCLFCDDCPSRTRGNGTHIAEVAFNRRDGAERILEMNVRPLSDVEGAHVGALVSFRDNTELAVLKRRVQNYQSLRGLAGRDPKMLALFDQIREVAAVNVPVLVQGESGTGKELVANAIHEESHRAGKPFVPINCGALPEGILESELFGHVRGAFTGAWHDKRGRFELADGGTIFLDEVGELSPAMQVKLLRVLQERSFERVGGERTIHIDVRVISATNQDLRKLMEQKRFRRDLYYRLCVIPITIPPLRERPLDIPILVARFLEEIASESGIETAGCSKDALDLLARHPWPGNVRELRNVVEYATVKCRSGQLGIPHLPPEIIDADAPAAKRPLRRGPAAKLTQAKVLSALASTGRNKSKAAKLLGVGRTTLYRHLASLGLDLADS